MYNMEIDIRDCKIEGNSISYEMSPAFTIFYLGYKHNLHGYYAPYIDVRGKEVKRFERRGMCAEFDLYENGEWRLLIKYRT